MKKQKIPYQKTVFVCTHTRDDGRDACANTGAGEEIYQRLRIGIHDAGLKKKVRVTHSGCLNLCAQGPNLLVYPDGDWYSEVAPGDVPAILKKLTG